MSKSYAELLREARSQIREVSPAEVEPIRERGDAVIVDVREASEWEQGHVPGAVHISKSYVEQQIEGAVPDRDRPVVLYCAGGVRSLFAAQTLRDMGYTDVASMAGGFQAWKTGGLPWTMPPTLTAEQKQRYSRHLLIPEVGNRRSGQAARLEGAVHRRRGSRLAGDALPRGRRGRHDRDRRLRHRRPVEPAAPGHPRQRPDRREEGRLGPTDDPGPQPGREGDRPRGDARRRQRRADHRRLRRHHRRDRHVRDPLSAERRSRRREHPGGPRQRLPVRGPADGLQAVRRAVLPLPLSDATAARARARLLRGRRPWRGARGSWACSRPTRRSSSCSDIGDSLAGRLLLFDALDASFSELRLRRDPACPVCSDAAVAAREAGRPLAVAGVGELGAFALGGPGLGVDEAAS